MKTTEGKFNKFINYLIDRYIEAYPHLGMIHFPLQGLNYEQVYDLIKLVLKETGLMKFLYGVFLHHIHKIKPIKWSIEHAVLLRLKEVSPEILYGTELMKKTKKHGIELLHGQQTELVLRFTITFAEFINKEIHKIIEKLQKREQQKQKENENETGTKNS